MFFYLRSHKSQHVVRQFQYWACKDFILYHIHLRAHFGFSTLIAYHAYLCPLKEPLRILTKQQHRRTAQRLILLATIVLFLYQETIFSDISLCALAIANQGHILLHQRHIQVIPACIVHWSILVVMFTLGIHQLHSLLKVQFFRLITHTVVHLIRLISMHPHTLRNSHQNDMILFSLHIRHLYILRRGCYGWHTIVKRSPQQLVHVICLTVHARQRAVILHAKSYLPTIRIGKCDDGYRQCLRVDASALPVKHLKLRRFLYLFYSHIVFSFNRVSQSVIPFIFHHLFAPGT